MKRNVAEHQKCTEKCCILGIWDVYICKEIKGKRDRRSNFFYVDYRYSPQEIILWSRIESLRG